MSNTGSLVNYLANQSAPSAIPKVGDGATLIMYSDRSPYTIVEVSKSGKRIGVQPDDARRVDENGYSEIQEYVYTRRPETAVQYYSRRKDGSYRAVGESMQGCRLMIGHREKY